MIPVVDPAKSGNRHRTSDGSLRSGRNDDQLRFFDGLNNKDAMKQIIEYMEEKGIGKGTVNFRLRDWLISRQRYGAHRFR